MSSLPPVHVRTPTDAGANVQGAVATFSGLPSAPSGPDGLCYSDRVRVRVEAPGMGPYDDVYDKPDLQGVMPISLQPYASGGILPRLHLEGLDFVTEDGRPYLVVGSTELMLGWRYDLEGPDAIRPVLEERQRLGFNNLRVLWQKDVGNTGSGKWLMPIEKLRPFLDLLAGHGFYTEGVILADCQVCNPSVRSQQDRVSLVRTATAGCTSLLEQLGNEYEKNGFNPADFSKPTDRLAANASNVEGGRDALPYWDFFCFSGQRAPLNHAIREYGPIEFMYGIGAWGGVPAICDEGMKPGINSSDPRDFERAGAQARSGCGGRFHSTSGTAGNSCLFTELEARCAAAFVKGMTG